MQEASNKKQQHQPETKHTKPILPIVTVPKSNHNDSTPLPDSHFQEQMQKYKNNYLHLLRENQILQANLTKVMREKQQLQQKFHTMHHHSNHEKSETQEKKKRHRRVASEIMRQYCCPDEKCGKSYGTDASLVQHIKLKHREYFETPQYESFINELRKSKCEKKDDRIPLNILEQENNRSA